MIRPDPTPPRLSPSAKSIALAGQVADALRALPLPAPASLGRGLQEALQPLGQASQWKAWPRQAWAAWGALGHRWLAPKAWWAATALPPVLASSWVLQHHTPCFEWWPLLSDAYAWGAAALAGMVSIGLLARNGAHRVALGWTVGLTGLACGELALWSARHQYQGEAALVSPLIPPRQQVKLAVPWTELTLQAADGQRLQVSCLFQGHPKAILLVPGWHGHRDDLATVSLAQWLGQRFDVMVMEPRGQGRQSGWKGPDLPEKADLLAGIAKLKEDGHARVILWAEAEAGWPAMAAVALKPGVDALIWAGPLRHWGGALDQDGWLGSPAGALRRWSIRSSTGLRLRGGEPGPTPQALAKWVAPTPFLLMVGSMQGPEAPQSLFQAMPEPKSLIALGNPGPAPSWDRYAAYHAEATRWLELVTPLGLQGSPLLPEPQGQPAGASPPAKGEAHPLVVPPQQASPAPATGNPRPGFLAPGVVPPTLQAPPHPAPPSGGRLVEERHGAFMTLRRPRPWAPKTQAAEPLSPEAQPAAVPPAPPNP